MSGNAPLYGRSAAAFSHTERDPHGADPHTPGAKLDAGKTRAGLVLGDFARALEQVSRVGTFGAQKYTDHGWLSVPGGVGRYTDAMLRHWLAEHTGAPPTPKPGCCTQRTWPGTPWRGWSCCSSSARAMCDCGMDSMAELNRARDEALEAIK